MSRSSKNRPKGNRPGGQSDKTTVRPTGSKVGRRRPEAAPEAGSPQKGLTPRGRVIVFSLLAAVGVLLAVYTWTAPLRARYSLRSATLNDLLAASHRDPNDPLSFYYLGLRWLQLGQPALAEQSLRRAADLDSDDEASWVGAAIADGDAGNFHEGVGIVSLFLRRHPHSANAHYTLAQIYDKMGSAQNAYSEALVATAINPKDSDAWRLAAREAVILGNNTQAEANYRQAIAQDPQDWRSRTEWGRLLASQARYQEAASLMREAVRLAPSEALPPLYLGKILLAQSQSPADIETARQFLLQSFALQPNNAEVEHQLGLSEMRLDHWDAARSDLLQALQFAPADPGIVNDLVAVDRHLPNNALLARDLSREQQLKNYYESLQPRLTALRSEPFNSQEILSLARDCAKNGDDIQATRLYKMALDNEAGSAVVRIEAGAAQQRAASEAPIPLVAPDPTAISADESPLPVLLRDANALVNEGDADQAQSAYLNILLIDGKDSEAFQGLARLMKLQGDLAQARFYDQKALDFNPRLWRVHFDLAALDNQAGLYKESVQQYREGLAIVPNDADGWHSLGTTLVQVDDWFQDAEDAMRHAVQLAPENAAYLRDLADLQVIRNELSDAEANYRKALAAAPNDEVTQTHLANFLIVNRPSPAGLAEADRLLQSAASTAPNDRTVSYWQGRLALERGDGQAAIPALLYVAEHSHRSEAAEAWYSLSRAYKLTGQDKLAAEAQTYSDKMRSLDLEMKLVINQVANHPTDISSSLKLAVLYANDSDFDLSIKQYQEVLHVAPGNGAARKQLAALNAYLKAHPELAANDQST